MNCWQCNTLINASPKDYYLVDNEPVCSDCAEEYEVKL